jgi:hypothetical protein
VVNYVQSLWTHGEEPQPKAVVTAVRHNDALPLSADDPAWQEVEANWYPLVGQVISFFDKRLINVSSHPTPGSGLQDGKLVLSSFHAP